MKISELKQIINGLDDDLDVIISRDEEGNGFSHLDDYTLDMGYYEGGYRDLEICHLELTPELKDAGYTEEDIRTDANPCIILWP